MAVIACVVALAAGAAHAQSATASATAGAKSSPIKVEEATPGLLKKAKITPEAALAAAQIKVPNGKFDAAEIEQEDGKLMYSFDFKVAGRTGIDEVSVDAMTGKAGKPEHETPEAIAKEKKADSVAAAKAKAKAGKGGR
jgi:uncharacterized membrane protein YkoI